VRKAPVALRVLEEKTEAQLEAILREKKELRRPKDWRIGVFRTKTKIGRREGEKRRTG